MTTKEITRTNVSITSDLATRLRQIAREEDRSMCAVMRRALDLYVSAGERTAQPVP